MRGAPDRRTPHFSTITPPTGFLPKPVAILLPPGPTPPETPESTLTVVMVPSYPPPPPPPPNILLEHCLLCPPAIPFLSGLLFCLSHTISALSSPLLAFLPAIHSILVSTPEPPLFFPLVISPHHSLSWNLHLEPPTPLSVHLHQEFQHSSLLPIATAPS